MLTPEQEMWLAAFADRGIAADAYEAKVREVDAARAAVVAKNASLKPTQIEADPDVQTKLAELEQLAADLPGGVNP